MCRARANTVWLGRLSIVFTAYKHRAEPEDSRFQIDGSPFWIRSRVLSSFTSCPCEWWFAHFSQLSLSFRRVYTCTFMETATTEPGFRFPFTMANERARAALASFCNSPNFLNFKFRSYFFWQNAQGIEDVYIKPFPWTWVVNTL